MNIEIRKIETIPPYPKNGNFGTQRKAYIWELRVNGKPDGIFSTRKKAQEAAREYTN